MVWLRGHKGIFWIAAMSVAVILVGFFLVWAFSPVQAGSPHEYEFTIQSGWGGGRIATELKSAGFVRWAPAVVLYANAIGAGDRLQAGTYLLSKSMTPIQIVRIIASGQAVSNDIEVTIPEGMNVWEIDRLLTAAGLIRAGELRAAFSFKEGHLFPETYRFAKDATVEDIVHVMEATYFERGGTRGDIDLIVASILEKEAKTPEDMAMVAGIIQKRLKIGMALQIDATVGYGWCVRVAGFTRDCDVTRAPIATEIRVDGPYNTYTRTGLPQGAISNPGTNALKAAANPTSSDYLYYLSTRDGSEIIYSKTLDEHLNNRLKYLGF
jgi:peptidoglycan lytic transglycosylase G